MNDLVAGWSVADFAEAAQPCAVSKGLFLRIGEVEKTQHQCAGAVADLHQQRAAASEANLAMIDTRLDHYMLAGTHGAKRVDAGAILIAKRQVKQHILDAFDAKTRKTLGNARTDAFQRGYRQLLQ